MLSDLTIILVLCLVQGVVASVSQQYAAMVSELLDMLQKTEQSLARVRRNKPADAVGAADGAELSNIQKISLQLFLDTQVRSCFHVHALNFMLSDRLPGQTGPMLGVNI